MNDEIKTIERSITKQQAAIGELEKAIETAPSFEASENLRRDLRESVFDLGQLKRDLQQAVEAQRLADHQAAVERYQDAVLDYNRKLEELDILGKQFAEAINAANTCFTERVALLTDVYGLQRKLANEADVLGQARPPKPMSPWRSDNVKLVLADSITENGLQFTYIGRILLMTEKKELVGPWVETGGPLP